jgi:hypothetical protein
MPGRVLCRERMADIRSVRRNVLVLAFTARTKGEWICPSSKRLHHRRLDRRLVLADVDPVTRHDVHDCGGRQSADA